MSAKKSWDVVRKPVEPAHPVATHAPVSVPRRTPKAARRPLKEARKKQRRIFLIVLIAIVAVLIASALYIIWLPALRVDTVTASGISAEGVKSIATQQFEGHYWYGIPRNSIFFVPESQIRIQVLKAFPEISAVSIQPTSLHGVAVSATSRASAFIWCGVSIDTPTADGACFNTDAEGLIFSVFDVGTENASSTLRIFAPLDQDIAIGVSPIGAHAMHPERIPDALRFVKAMRGLGAPVSALAIKDDEADLYLQGPGRIRYVLGREEQAAQLAASALPTINLTSSSIEYIDLRFTGAPNQSGKVYVKRFGE